MKTIVSLAIMHHRAPHTLTHTLTHTHTHTNTQPPPPTDAQSTSMEASDSDDDISDPQRYLRAPTHPRHVRIGEDFQAALPSMGQQQEERGGGGGGGEEGENQENQMIMSQEEDGGQRQTDTHTHIRSQDFMAGRVDFDEDGLGTGAKAYH